MRGGLPESLYADSDNHSFAWRRSYLDSILNQDYICWNVDASDRLPEVFQWVANNNGRELDESNCANSLSIKKESVRRSLDLLERVGLLRRLPNWPAGSNKSMKNMPLYYLRDCGLLHAALGINSIDILRESEARGHSWAGFAIEAIINAAQGSGIPAFYRDKDKNEIDLVLNFSSGKVLAIECKVNEKKGVEKGFAIACTNIGATQRLVVHTGGADKKLEEGVSRLTLFSAIRSLPE